MHLGKNKNNFDSYSLGRLSPTKLMRNKRYLRIRVEKKSSLTLAKLNVKNRLTNNKNEEQRFYDIAKISHLK